MRTQSGPDGETEGEGEGGKEDEEYLAEVAAVVDAKTADGDEYEDDKEQHHASVSVQARKIERVASEE